MTLEDLSTASDRELYECCCKMDPTAWTCADVTLKIIEKGLGMLEDPGAFKSFVKRITVNLILDHYKRKIGEPLSPEGEVMDRSGENPRMALSSNEPLPESRIFAKESFGIMYEILKELPEYCREIIKAYMAYQMGDTGSYEEMAKKLNLSVSTVGVRIKRCKDFIRNDERFRGLLD